MHALTSFSLAGLDGGTLVYAVLVVFVAATNDLVTSHVALRTALFAIPLIAGVALGNRQFLKTSPESFRRFTLLLLMVLASLGLVRGWIG